MGWKTASAATGSAILALASAAPASAQATADDLMAMDLTSLRGEIQSRYDEALGLTLSPDVVSADTNQFMWASQAKAQCGIALGFLKSSTKDPVSIGKCVDAANRMRMVQVVQAPPPPPPDMCNEPIAGIVFFDFDSAIPPASANQTLDSVINYTKVCNWSRLIVTGHTDRSGSDAYNQGLSVRRAQAVAGMLEARGMPEGILDVSGYGESEPKVPTPDGERNPTNRRVEITVQ
ncbi:MAG: OmpA family protein [Novosphingobium sp.]